MDDFRSFQHAQPKDALAVVDVSLSDSLSCIRVYPAVLALAQNLEGRVSFARVLGDSSPAAQALMKELKIQSAPTFLFYRNGKPVGQYAGSSRADLIAEVILKQGTSEPSGIMDPEEFWTAVGPD